MDSYLRKDKEMSLANGRSILAIPGPSVIPDRVLNAMHTAAPNIYVGSLLDTTDSIVPDLKKIAKTDGYVAMYIGNGHAAWEASLANVLALGDNILVLATGRFGHSWAEMAKQRGLEVELVDFGHRSVVQGETVEQILNEDKKKKIKAVLVVQVDTATSAKTDILGIRQLINKCNHPALLMVDSIACLGCDEMHMDRWGVDVMVAGCQKGLMVPPGMSFVFFNEKAMDRRKSLKLVSSYWDWIPRAQPGHFYEYFCGTAPTHHLLGLREALTMILNEEGLDSVWKRHKILASSIWSALDRWSSEGSLELNIKEPKNRSHAVTAIRIDPSHGTKLRNWLTDNTGVTLGIGIGMADPNDPAWHGFFRIGHMGHLNAHMVLGTLGSIDAGLKSLKIPHGDGALEAASLICADS